MSQAKDMYQCQVHNCGYVYDPQSGDPKRGIKPGTAFADLLESWICPFCRAHKHLFKPLAGPGSVFWENVKSQPRMQGKDGKEIERLIAKGEFELEADVAKRSKGKM